MTMLLVLSVAFLVLALLAVPVAIALGLSALLVIAIWGMPGFILAQKMVNGIDSFPLLAVPFFILAASVMNSGGSDAPYRSASKNDRSGAGAAGFGAASSVLMS